MRSTKFWIIIFAVLLIISVATSIIIFQKNTKGVIANIYQDGECIESIDLSKVKESYTMQIFGKVTNIVAVEPGRIRVLEATCPDKVCVHQGWISNSVVPIVCLPNSLIIQIEETPGTKIDAIVR